MIFGMLLRNFKTYYGINYIPISEGYYFTTYIGENGVGKSSILEALNTYFNNTDWNVNNYSRTRGLSDSNMPYISIFFVLKPHRLIDDKENKNLVFELDKFLRSLKITDFQDNQLEAKKLIEHINRIKRNKDILLVGTGIKYGSDDFYLGSLEKQLMKYLDISNKNELREKFKGFNSYIRQHFSYIYIPLEIDVEEFTKLEKSDIQKLMGKDIKDLIREIIKDKSLREINKGLNDFINKIRNNLDPYFYHNKSGRKNITMNELVNEIIKLFFSIRTLHKKINKAPAIPVANLSSGEKKQVIIDIAESFINMQDNFEKEIILGIDEPESSLNISKKFNQFEKLFRLSKKNIQVLVTTHWYGFLPVMNEGNLYYLYEDSDIDKKVGVLYFDLFNYREKIRQHRQNNIKIPQEIELKSINDLIQSIISSLRADKPYNWLICEGSSEKIYFEYYFKDLVKDFNLRILPVGGYKEVKKIYEYLVLPLKDKDLNNSIKGKVFCLVDTDEQLDRFESNEDNRLIKVLKFRRLWNNERTNRTELLKMQDEKVSPSTEIEDCLEPVIFYKTIEFFGDCEIIKEIKENKKNEMTNSYFAFDLRSSERKKLKKWFDKYDGKRKLEFAKKYVEIAYKSKSSGLTLEWINEIKNFFKGT